MPCFLSDETVLWIDFTPNICFCLSRSSLFSNLFPSLSGSGLSTLSGETSSGRIIERIPVPWMEFFSFPRRSHVCIDVPVLRLSYDDLSSRTRSSQILFADMFDALERASCSMYVGLSS